MQLLKSIKITDEIIELYKKRKNIKATLKEVENEIDKFKINQKNVLRRIPEIKKVEVVSKNLKITYKPFIKSTKYKYDADETVLKEAIKEYITINHLDQVLEVENVSDSIVKELLEEKMGGERITVSLTDSLDVDDESLFIKITNLDDVEEKFTLENYQSEFLESTD
jgi:hypothetical protein